MKILLIILVFLISCTETPKTVEPKIEIDSMPKLLVIVTTPCLVIVRINDFVDTTDFSKLFEGIPDTFNMFIGYNKVQFNNSKPVEYYMNYWQEELYYFSCY